MTPNAVSAINSLKLQVFIDRMRAGDERARDDLIRSVYKRLGTLTRQMLRGFPGVRRWDETGDVLHPSLLRLLRALKEVRPDSIRAFLGLAALQIRRELLDRAHQYSGSKTIAEPSRNSNLPIDRAEPTDDPSELERWTAFHDGVDRLPEDQRDVVSLVFYHGLTKEQAAAVLEVDPKTVGRRWRLAMTRLHRVIEPDERPIV